MDASIILVVSTNVEAAALFVQGRVLLTLQEALSYDSLKAKAYILAKALEVEVSLAEMQTPAKPQWQDMCAEVLAHVKTKTTMSVKHWDCYGSEHASAYHNTHKFEIDDLRLQNGQARMCVQPLEDVTDGAAGLLDVLLEVNTSPLDGLSQLPCAQVHVDSDDPVLTIFQDGDELVLVPNTNIALRADVIAQADGAQKTVYRVAGC